MFGLMLKSTHDAALAEISSLFAKEEFSGVDTVAEKAALALERLEQHRLSQFRQRQRALTAGAALNEALKERDEARAELSRWKPARDAKGHFIKADAQKERV